MNEKLTWEQTCPLCGGENGCAIAAHQPPQDCWCMNVTISAQALSALPEESIGKRCLCHACGAVEGGSTDAG